MDSAILYLGTHSHVAAFDRATGAELWRTKLKGTLTSDDFVSLLVQPDRLYAHTGGELYCLDSATGAILWKNGLTGLGYGIASLAVVGQPSVPPPLVAAQRARSAQSGTIAATSAST